MTIHEIDEALVSAEKRLETAIKGLVPKHKGGEWDEYRAANARVLELERLLAQAKGEQYADVSDFPVKWDTGAPLPHVLANDHCTFLIFYVREVDPNWDGTSVTVKAPADGQLELLASVEFNGCVSFRMGAPNDEVFDGHPLSGKGLDSYTAQIVRNSEWIKELENINKAHAGYNADRWKQLTHYIFWFHDSTFECVARSYSVETFRKSAADLLASVCSRLLK